MAGSKIKSPFPGCVDLASARVGGKAVKCSDDFFAPMKNLLEPGRGVFLPEKFTSRGKWMDGWESRRKRVPGHDWCVIKLGLPGRLYGLDIDTNHFLGNHPPFASVDAGTGGKWTPILKKSGLKPGSQHFFKISSPQRWTHLRLNIFPDGGVARLRAYGVALPELKRGQKLDLASVLNGGCVADCNDAFFGPKDNLIMPGRAKNMGDGWETKRKRVPGHDWVVVRLGKPGTLDKIELDTNHFKGNFPDRVSLEGILSRHKADARAKVPKGKWIPVLAKTKLRGHTRHFFTKQLLSKGPFDYLRMRIFPDGGISRMRVWGTAQ